MAHQGVHEAVARVEKTSKYGSALEYVRLLRAATLDQYHSFQEYAAVDKPSYWDEDGYGSCRFTGLLCQLKDIEDQIRKEGINTGE